jgi:pimeloyl-ACP methyl ester carboxylesterase
MDANWRTAVSTTNVTPPTVRPQAAPPARRWLRWTGRGLLGLVIALVALPLAGAAYQAVATELDARAYPPPGQLVDVGGHRVHLEHMGDDQGGPTVVLLGCGGCTTANWGWVQPEVARFARVVAYDWAGRGGSDPSPQPRDARRLAQELDTLLGAAGIGGPYVLVGYSFGGPVARVYAADFPAKVAGMVLLDPRHPDQATRFPPEAAAVDEDGRRMIATLGLLARLGVLRLTSIGADQVMDLPAPQRLAYSRSYNTSQFWDSIQAHNAAIADTDAQARQAGGLGDRPLIVLSAGRAWLAPDAPADATRRVQTELNQEQAALSSHGRHRAVDEATHTSLVNNRGHARATIDAIRQVVEAVRAGRPLPLDG